MAINRSTVHFIFKSPLFWLGLLIRFGLIYFALSATPIVTWYAPFIEASINTITFDPWSSWIAQSETPLAFPYGYVMWLAFLPFAFIAKVIGLGTGLSYLVTLLTFDLALLYAFTLYFSNRPKLVLLGYWLSPILLFSTYYLGFNDIIPVALLTFSLFQLKNNKAFYAGALLLCAISAKLSMVLALPFFLIYFFHNKPIRQIFPQFVKGFCISLALLFTPFLVSPGAIQMLFSNPEIPKLYQFSLSLGPALSIYLTPLAYILAIYVAWSVKRINFELFQATLGIAFLTIVLLTPASPGWFVWCIPLLLYFQVVGGKKAFFLCSMFSLIFVLSNLVNTGAAQIPLFVDLLPIGKIGSLLHTFLVATGIVLIALIWKKTIGENDYFKLSRKPFVIGISGDSGSGKDTLSNAITEIFGKHSVTTLSGDDYHLWDRNKPLWQVMTHLNPMANDLESFSNDLVNLSARKSINSRHYNHATGKLTTGSSQASNDIIIASGLHTLHLPTLRDRIDLKIFLNIDEDLRRRLKIERDVGERGHSEQKVLESIEKRVEDGEKFIRPQMQHADLCLSLSPINPNQIRDYAQKIQSISLKLLIESKIGINQYNLIRVLVSACGLHVDHQWNQSSQAIELSIEGDVSAADIEMATNLLCPRLKDFLDLNPTWENGPLGLMQLITLVHIDQLLARRSVS
jgi:uridine kinase